MSVLSALLTAALVLMAQVPARAAESLALAGSPPVAAESPARAREAAQQAEAQAQAAAARVDALLDRHQRASEQVADGVGHLAHAFATLARADSAHQLAGARQAQTQAMQRRQVRDIYVSGGSSGVLSSVLGARTPDDALWRMTTAGRVMGSVLASTQTQAQRDAAASVMAGFRASQSAAAVQEQAQALQALQAQAGQAERALRTARATLTSLTAQARRSRAAAVAAQRIAAAQAAARLASRPAPGSMQAMPIPAEYRVAYQAAARTCPQLDWTLLAAVGQVESAHGRNTGPSSAGAIGPMQFMPATFAGYAVDGDQDGRRDAWDPQDSIFTAAHYLCASGADGTSQGIQRALFAYNHAQWYVDLVLSVQDAILTVETQPVP